ncbi:MAG: TetR/AcrR family transcriptional regulator [Comamonadaceae bacterium]|nr:MAG: TetR/AcrR family transcriptional regulator [Comamonadaceae bacterium]
MLSMVDSLVNSGRPGTYPEAPADAAAAPAARRRMTTAERERHIVEGAITFFSEHGMDAQMRELASAIGVTHTLVYHYFPTKQALLDRVYVEVFEGRWKPEWEALLDDRALAVEEKLVRFYVDYARTVLTREFVRILIFSGLSDRGITDRFFGMLGERLFPRLVRETRRHRGSRSRARTTAREHELLMGLHGGVFYGGLRAFVYGQAQHPDAPALDDRTLIADRVRSYLDASLTLEPAGTQGA